MTIELQGKQLINKRIAYLMRSLSKDSPNLFTMYNRIGSFLVTQIRMNIKKESLVDLGGLINSIQYKIESDGVNIGSFGVPYAAIHEFGGVIKPVKAKWLTIPTEKYKRFKAKQVKGLRFIQRLKDARTKAFLIDTNNNELAFTLVKRVNIKPRPYFIPAIKSSRQHIRTIMIEEIQNVLNGV